jgi:dTDP-glucose 4,6-dehydratase/UDP-glucose 4-epimerase
VIAGAATTAAETHVGQSPEVKFSTVVDGTRRLLSALDASHPCRVILISSGSTCGTSLLSPKALIPEGWPEAPPMKPGAALGHAKRAAEFMALIHGNLYPDHSVSVIRCFSFSGPAMPLNLHYAIGNFVQAASTGQPIIVRSNGSATRSFMHMGDMTTWLLQALAIAPPGCFMNFGSEHGLSILQLAELVQRTSKQAVPIQVMGSHEGSPSTSASSSYVPSTFFTRGALEVDEWTTLEESVNRWIEFLRQ